MCLEAKKSVNQHFHYFILYLLFSERSVSDPNPDPIFFQLVSDFNLNFTIVFPSCKCVMLHIMTRYKLFRNILL
jgi:hypothetical protein